MLVYSLDVVRAPHRNRLHGQNVPMSQHWRCWLSRALSPVVDLTLVPRQVLELLNLALDEVVLMLRQYVQLEYFTPASL
jgi:hypothetical protein